MVVVVNSRCCGCCYIESPLLWKRHSAHHQSEASNDWISVRTLQPAHALSLNNHSFGFLGPSMALSASSRRANDLTGRLTLQSPSEVAIDLSILRPKVVSHPLIGSFGLHIYFDDKCLHPIIFLDNAGPRMGAWQAGQYDWRSIDNDAARRRFHNPIHATSGIDSLSSRLSVIQI